MLHLTTQRLNHLFTVVCALSLGTQAMVSRHLLFAARQPRMPSFDRLFYVQVGV